MRVARLGFLAGVLGSLVLGCGGGGSGPNPPPPPPPAPGNLVKQAGDNQNGNVGEPVPVRPSVKVTSTTGAAISGVTVTFAVASGGGSVTGAAPTTGSDGVATVGSWILGPAAGANTLTASISGSGVVGNPATFTAMGALTAFNPTANTTLSGNVAYASVNIPAGVTVTVSNDAVITVTGAYTQAGTLLAPCHALTLVVDGPVTVTGNVSNQCAAPTANAPDLRIVGKTSYSFSNGTIATSGDLSIVNDPTEGLNFASAMAPARLRMPDPKPASVTIGRCNFDNETIDIGDAPDGTTASPNGAAGSSAFLGCGFLFSGNTGGTVTMNNTTINGADGGDGLADVKSNAAATGGHGGPPGPVFVSADDDIELSGSITINGGDGGDGGSATSTGTDGNPGNSATATGGDGGGLDPGEDPVRFEAGGAITQIGSLAVVIGTAGFGGSATATGGNGVAASPGAPGGSQTAAGGNGGNGMNVRMNASGAVSLGGSVTISGGAAGAGGAVTCLGGNGGDGAAPGAPGGPAGAKNCRGGNGGQGGTASLRTATLRVDENPLALNPATPGGDAGSASFGGGKGGNGAPNCPAGPGGTGGKGSDISGGDGSRGIGNPNGAGANATVTDAANGGNGAAPGAAGGGAGANNLTHGAGGVGPFNIVNSFNPGIPGGPCPPQISLISASPNNPTIQQGSSATLSFLLGRVNYTGNVLVELLDQNGTVRGSTTVSGPAGTSGSIGFTVPGAEPIGTRNWSLRASGTGVSTVTLAYPINVTAASGSSSVAITNVTTNSTATAGSPSTFEVTVARTNLTTNVTVLIQNETGANMGNFTIPGPAGTSGSGSYTPPVTSFTGAHTFRVAATASGVSPATQDVPVNIIPPATVGIDLNTMPHNGNLVSFGTHVLNLVVNNTQVGIIQVQTVFNSGNHFWSNSIPAGLRVGSGDGNGFRILFNTALVNGSAYAVDGFGYCLLNPTGVDVTHPVTKNQRDLGGTILNTETLTSIASPLCRWSTIVSGAASLEILAPMGAGRFIDSGTWQLWRP